MDANIYLRNKQEHDGGSMCTLSRFHLGCVHHPLRCDNDATGVEVRHEAPHGRDKVDLIMPSARPHLAMTALTRGEHNYSTPSILSSRFCLVISGAYNHGSQTKAQRTQVPTTAFTGAYEQASPDQMGRRDSRR